MYDVLYLDKARKCQVLASGLTRESATDVAKREARARGASRMFISGSASVPRSHVVLIVRTGP